MTSFMFVQADSPENNVHSRKTILVFVCSLNSVLYQNLFDMFSHVECTLEGL